MYVHNSLLKMDRTVYSNSSEVASAAPTHDLIESGPVTPLGLTEPLVSSTGTVWSGFPLEAHRASEGGFITHPALPYCMVVLCTGGQARVLVEAGGIERRFILERGKLCIYPAGCEIESFSWSGIHETLVVELRPWRLKHLLGDDDRLVNMQLAPQYGISDLQIPALLRNMRAEIEAGCPSGRLYGESLSLALLTYLANRYPAGTHRAESRKFKLSPAQFGRVRDYVRAHLSQELGLAELAGVIQLSPHHFCFLFKNTAGITPYQYVLRERVHESMKHLAARQCSIVEIAGVLGFADQSHFTTVFRRVTGLTPKQYQRGF
jgi:AraC family transcriptional regulator